MLSTYVCFFYLKAWLTGKQVIILKVSQLTQYRKFIVSGVWRQWEHIQLGLEVFCHQLARSHPFDIILASGPGSIGLSL